jgi:hypothetical protein
MDNDDDIQLNIDVSNDNAASGNVKRDAKKVRFME